MTPFTPEQEEAFSRAVDEFSAPSYRDLLPNEIAQVESNYTAVLADVAPVSVAPLLRRYDVQSFSSSVLSADVLNVIRQHLPEGDEDVREKLYQMTKALRLLPEWYDAEEATIRQVGIEWLRRASGMLKLTTEWEVTVTLLHKWRKYGDQPRRLMRRIMSGEAALPAEVLALPDAPLRELAGLCFHLQRHHGNAPFFLSVRKVVDLLGMNSNSGHALHVAGYMLRHLADIGLIVLVRKGVGKEASRFRYVGQSIAPSGTEGERD